MSKVALRSPRVLLPGGFAPATVTIDGDTIAAIGPEPAPGAEVREVDGELLPALTDTHVHVDEPGRTAWEGFASATRAAAAGGVTLLVDMPLNSDPVTTSEAALQAKLQATGSQLHIDCGFWGGVVPGNARELAPMARAGVLGFKCFTCHSGIDEFPASRPPDLRVAMPILRDAGVPLLVHAELESELRDAASDADPRAYATYLHSRPGAAEVGAIAMIVDLVRETGCRAHIVHLSSADALPLLRRAKAEGLPITAETCPHYLGLAAEDVPDGDTAWKCSPPIRERENQDRLWAGLRDGTIDFVVTDHSPCVPSLKKLDTGDFMGAWGGIASLQLGLRSVWTEARRRGVALETVIGWMARDTAAFLGQERGSIAVGRRADLVEFRSEGESAVDPTKLLHRHPTTPWAGKRLAGEVVRTWMGGAIVAERGQAIGPQRGSVILGGAR